MKQVFNILIIFFFSTSIFAQNISCKDTVVTNYLDSLWNTELNKTSFLKKTILNLETLHFQNQEVFLLLKNFRFKNKDTIIITLNNSLTDTVILTKKTQKIKLVLNLNSKNELIIKEANSNIASYKITCEYNFEENGEKKFNEYKKLKELNSNIVKLILENHSTKTVHNTINVDDKKEMTLKIWDYKRTDNDEISIFVNGRVQHSNVIVNVNKKYAIKKKITLLPCYKNELLFIIESKGKGQSACTIKVEIVETGDIIDLNILKGKKIIIVITDK